MELFSKAEDFINRHGKIILTAHETPDGDAVGSECAMYHALEYLKKEVRIFNADPVEEKYAFLNTDRLVFTLNSPEELNIDPSDWALIILDTNDTNNIGQIEDILLPMVKEYLIIDHHEGGGQILTNTLIAEDASSTCEILYDLFKALNIEIDKPMAEALYTGILYDTGSFIYPKTTAFTFKIAHDLVVKGVKPNFIYSNIYENNSISSLLLQSRVLSTIEMHFDEQAAVQTMVKETIIECGATYDEGNNLINIPLKCRKILVSIFFKENLEGVLRCSLRSKGNLDVGQIAQAFGGGGHKTAAGFKCKLSLEPTKEKVLEMIRERYF